MNKSKTIDIIFIVAIVIVAVIGIAFLKLNKKEDTKDISDNIYASGKHHAVLTIKDYGDIELELDADIAPISVANFAKLVDINFYDGLTFHRIINGFMMQGGASKDGKKVDTIKGEFSENGVKNSISHVRGAISMARANSNNSASSQFFIVHKDSLHLDGKYAAFGHVTRGMEIVDEICEKTPVTDDNGTVLEENQPVIEKIVMVD